MLQLAQIGQLARQQEDTLLSEYRSGRGAVSLDDGLFTVVASSMGCGPLLIQLYRITNTLSHAVTSIACTRLTAAGDGCSARVKGLSCDTVVRGKQRRAKGELRLPSTDRVDVPYL